MILNIVCTLVDRRKEMLGVFSPQAEAYTHEMPEEITPSGIFARGSYSARTKVPSFLFVFVLFNNKTAARTKVVSSLLIHMLRNRKVAKKCSYITLLVIHLDL